MAERFASALSTLDPLKGRFALPRDVLESAGWPMAGDVPEVVAGIVEAGHLRLYLKAAIAAQLAELEAAATTSELDSREYEARLQSRADRYRPVSLSRTDGNRVTLPQELVIVVTDGSPIGESIKLFVQAGAETIEVMTQAVRLQRLRRERAF